ncbi:hypothetical protein [Flavobacterium sp.]|uniref:hypothetical protein n=1 Tax=Flavobacterium sp. TaxID=239 RepID=UPI00120F4CEE|nr:hypothetical protein [Flavobacterium sp.]RZJ71701.1 MAG: hypothetical protein EOO49_08520 [Flavobacterium sp.]
MKKIGLLLLFVLAACSKPEPKLFSHDGVSFNIPGDWKIAEQEAITEIGYYLAAQKEGLSSSGLFTLSWVKGDLDANENLQTYQSEMNSNMTYSSSGLVFTPTKPGKFAGNETLSCDFTANILTVKHHGTLHCFHLKGRTYTVLIQEADEDVSDNKEGYELIEKTFAVKG